VGARGSTLESDPDSDSDVRSGFGKEKSSSSSSLVCKRREVKNSENVTPRLHVSMAKASYVRGPNSSSGARYGLHMDTKEKRARQRRINHNGKEHHVPRRHFKVHSRRRLGPQISGFRSAILAHAKGDPKVDELCTARWGQEDVARLDIPVCDLDMFAVEVAHPTKDLKDDRLGKDDKLDLARGRQG
jgi:hypothetical protein